MKFACGLFVDKELCSCFFYCWSNWTLVRWIVLPVQMATLYLCFQFFFKLVNKVFNVFWLNWKWKIFFDRIITNEPWPQYSAWFYCPAADQQKFETSFFLWPFVVLCLLGYVVLYFKQHFFKWWLQSSSNKNNSSLHCMVPGFAGQMPNTEEKEKNPRFFLGKPLVVLIKNT